MDNLCFVIQPYDQGKFDQRYHEIIKPTIESCGLIAYRVDEDYKVDVPVSAIETNLKKAALVVAEITTDRPNVWFELGYALAPSKTVILLCSDERDTAIPFDVRHRNVLKYRTGSPTAYERFRQLLSAYINARYTVDLRRHGDLTSDESVILKFISEDQKSPFSMTAEETVINYLITNGFAIKQLRSLIKKGFLEYLCSTTDGNIYYHITEKAEKALFDK